MVRLRTCTAPALFRRKPLSRFGEVLQQLEGRHFYIFYHIVALCCYVDSHVNKCVLDIFWIWTGSPRIICDGEGFPDLLRLPGSLDRRVLTVCPCPVWFSPKSCALWIPLVPLLQVLAQDHWQEVRLERDFWFSSAPEWQSVTMYTTHSITWHGIDVAQ